MSKSITHDSASQALVLRNSVPKREKKKKSKNSDQRDPEVEEKRRQSKQEQNQATERNSMERNVEVGLGWRVWLINIFEIS